MEQKPPTLRRDICDKSDERTIYCSSAFRLCSQLCCSVLVKALLYCCYFYHYYLSYNSTQQVLKSSVFLMLCIGNAYGSKQPCYITLMPAYDFVIQKGQEKQLHLLSGGAGNLCKRSLAGSAISHLAWLQEACSIPCMAPAWTFSGGDLVSSHSFGTSWDLLQLKVQSKCRWLFSTCTAHFSTIALEIISINTG